jgi:hypothetical protein
VKAKYKAFLEPAQEDSMALPSETNAFDFMNDSMASSEDLRKSEIVLAGRPKRDGGDPGTPPLTYMKAREGAGDGPEELRKDGEG